MDFIAVRSDVRKLLRHQTVSRNAGGRHTALEILQSGVDIGAGTALCLATAKAAVLTGNKITKTGESLLCNRLDAIAPCFQLLHGDDVGGVAVKARLVNAHAYLFDGVTKDRGVTLESTKGIKPHLRIANGGHGHAFPMLVVRDAEGVPANHHIVAGAKALRHIVVKINLDLCGNGRRTVIEHCLLREVFHVKVCGLVHFRVIKRLFLEFVEAGGVGAGGHQSEFLEGLEFCNGVSQAPLLRIFACAFRQTLLKTGSRCAVEPSCCR